jgi:hypothetical protein
MDPLASFRVAAERENQGRDRSGWRYSKATRELATAFCGAERRVGKSFATIAERLQISTLTLGRWLEEPAEPAFQEVKIFEGSPGGLRVVLPSGLSIEGLDLAQAVELAKLLP